MYKNTKVVAVTPAGRRKYMEVLAPYVFREKHLFDEWMIWVNTGRESDLAYLEALAASNKGFVRLVRYKEQLTTPAPQPWWYGHASEPNVLYVKFDDDICWVHPKAVEELLCFRIRNPKFLYIFSNTINNGYCAYIHSKRGSQDFHVNGEYLRIAPDCYNIVWSKPSLGEYVHNVFIKDLLNEDIDKYFFDCWELDAYQRFQINCVCWWGQDVNGVMGGEKDEEAWMTMRRPKELGRTNAICGTSLVSHFAFYKQRKPHCVGKEINNRIHDAYRVLSYRLGDVAKNTYGLESLPSCNDQAVNYSLKSKNFI